MCKAAAVPVVANADYVAADVPIGDTLTYTCAVLRRVAPAANPAAPPTTITVTCQSDGTFTTPVGSCVCKYYYIYIYCLIVYLFNHLYLNGCLMI